MSRTSKNIKKMSQNQCLNSQSQLQDDRYESFRQLQLQIYEKKNHIPTLIIDSPNQAYSLSQQEKQSDLFTPIRSPKPSKQKKMRLSKHCEINILQQFRKRISKNNNVIKHLLKKYVENFHKRGKRFFNGPTLQRKVKRFVDNEKKCYRLLKNYNNNLESMKKFFGVDNSIDRQSDKRELFSSASREYAHELIREEVIPKLKQNKQVNHLLHSYLLTLKVQMHRCRNSTLMCRTQCH